VVRVSLVCESKAGFWMSALTYTAMWFLIWCDLTSWPCYMHIHMPQCQRHVDVQDKRRIGDTCGDGGQGRYVGRYAGV
jgi:hypothetical protein